MTIEQERGIRKAVEGIKEVRGILDGVMYGKDRDELTEKEFSKIREAYDLICKANDKL